MVTQRSSLMNGTVMETLDKASVYQRDLPPTDQSVEWESTGLSVLMTLL